MTKGAIILVAMFLSLGACTKTQKQLKILNTSASEFKAIGYYASWSSQPDSLNLDGLTHINFSFAIPDKTENKLQPIEDVGKLRRLVEIGHKKGKKIILAVGGWDIEDGGGNDARFHRIASKSENRAAFIKNIMQVVEKYELDGIDMDWEYPDENSQSADDYLALMKELGTELHKQNKVLSAAVVAYGNKGGGVKKEVFDVIDWLNLMAYDDDDGVATKPHSPYELAEKSLNYWLNERKLPAEKAILGLPFYGKPYHDNMSTDFKDLIKAGADPQKDIFKDVQYNGWETIQKKTELAKKMNCGGVMIWEIAADAHGERSLIKAINEVK